MAIFSLKPARKYSESEVILDLDKLTSEPQTFRWNGSVHEIKCITTETFFKVTAEVAKLDSLRRDDVTDQDFIDGYTRVFSSVCASIGRKEVMKMTIPQMGALLQYILDCINGRAQAEGYGVKKKTSLSQSTDQSQPPSA